MAFATSMHRYGFILVAPGHVLDTVCVQEEMVCERYGGVCVLTVSMGHDVGLCTWHPELMIARVRSADDVQSFVLISQ